VTTLLGDGSTRFIKDGIDPRLWKALSTRGGHETIDPSGF